jgi:hypothetical protein
MPEFRNHKIVRPHFLGITLGPQFSPIILELAYQFLLLWCLQK